MEINPLILALGKTLPESCLQGLVVYLALQLLFLVDKRSIPSVRFNLYSIASLCLFAGFILTLFHHYKQINITSFKPDLLPSKTGSIIPITITKPNLWLQLSFWINHYTYIIAGFYLAGLTFCMLKTAIGLIRISSFKKHKNLKLDQELTSLSIRLCSNFKLIKTVSVFVSNNIFVPFTIGFLKPIIVFPIALLNQLSAAQTEAILLHELAHIKRNDYLLNLLLCIVRSFLFFNPAVWLMEREINKYREQCCDDLVLDQTRNQLAYAHALLLIEEYRHQSLNLTLASNGNKYTLLNRIKRITNMSTNEPLPKGKLVVLLFALITVCVFVACNYSQKKVAKPYKLKRLSYTVYDTKSTGFNPEKPYAEWSTDTTKFIRKSEYDSLKVYTNKITYKPNKKHNKRYIFSGNNLIVNEFSDTPIHSKTKYKVTVEDSTGNKKEYNSFDELPEADRKEFMKSEPIKNLNSSKFKIDTTQLISVKKYFNSPQYKQQMEKLYKEMNSPEYKKRMKELFKKMNSPEYKVQLSQQLEKMKTLTQVFDSPEYKKQMKELMKMLIDSARKKWRNTTNYQPLPATTPIIMKPEQLH